MAISLYRQAGDYLLATTDTTGFAYSLLDISYSYANLLRFEESDSVWQQVLLFSDSIKGEVNSYLWFTRAYYHIKQKEGYEALMNLRNITLPPSGNDIYYLHLLTLAYYYNQQPDSATVFANRIIENSSATGFLMSAFAILQKIAFDNGNSKYAAYYENKCDSLQQQLDKCNEHSIRSIAKIENSLDDITDYRSQYKYAVGIGLPVGMCLVISLIILGFLFHHKRKQNIRQQSLLVMKKKQTQEERSAQLQNIIESLKEADIDKTLHWNDYYRSVQDINSYFYSLSDKLKAVYPEINLQEIRLCALVLMGYKQDFCAMKLGNISTGSFKKRKSRLAQSLRTNSVDFQDFLFSLSCNDSL